VKRGAAITEARLEAALRQSARIADEYPHLRPIYDAVEGALLDFRSTNPTVRARLLVHQAGTDATLSQG